MPKQTLHAGMILDMNAAIDGAHSVITYVAKDKAQKELIQIAVFSKRPVSWVPEEVVGLIYTWSESVWVDHWPIVGSIDLPDLTPLTIRHSAEIIWKGNDRIGHMTPELRNLIPMETAAFEGAVDKVIRQLLGEAPCANFAQRVQRATSELISGRPNKAIQQGPPDGGP